MTARIGLPDRATLPADVRAALAERPNVIHFALLAHASGVFRPTVEYAELLRSHLALPPRIRELAILRVTALVGCSYVQVSHHSPAAHAGIPADLVTAVLQPHLDPTVFTPAEAAALRFVDEMVTDHGAGSAAVDAVRTHFSERELVELGLVVGRYLGLSLLLNSLGLTADDQAEPVSTRAAPPG